MLLGRRPVASTGRICLSKVRREIPLLQEQRPRPDRMGDSTTEWSMRPSAEWQAPHPAGGDVPFAAIGPSQGAGFVLGAFRARASPTSAAPQRRSFSKPSRHRPHGEEHCGEARGMCSAWQLTDECPTQSTATTIRVGFQPIQSKVKALMPRPAIAPCNMPRPAVGGGRTGRR